MASGASLTGSGTFATSGGGVTVSAGGNLTSGAAQSSPPKVTPAPPAVAGLTLNNTTLTVGTQGSLTAANLTFYLGVNQPGSNTDGTLTSPNNNTTYLNLTNSSSVVFTLDSIASITLDDLTGSGSSSQLKNWYLLINGDSPTDISGLVIAVGSGADTTYYLSQSGVNGYVVGVYNGDNGSGPLTAADANPISILGLFIPGSDTPPPLYLNDGNLEVMVVPEPGTWALMLGGLMVLILRLRRKRHD
ncbi:MAG: PEP-CTERM sorting domain-containing protein [Verrucomicrobiota bacterium]